MNFQTDEVFYQGNNDEQKDNDEYSANDCSQVSLLCLEEESFYDQPTKGNQCQTNNQIVHYSRHELHQQEVTERQDQRYNQ